MNTPKPELPNGLPTLHTDDRSVRFFVYLLLISTSAATISARIVSVRSDRGDTPFLSANDRSRWSTIRAIVEERTFAIDSVIRDKSWDTIDKVRHADADGVSRFYSSKPPLLTTLMAIQYWLVHAVTGASLSQDPFYVGRMMLVLTNVVPLALYFVVLAELMERLSTSTWSKLFTMTAATWGTFLTGFAVTLNNHLPAAICALFAVRFALRAWEDNGRGWLNQAACGLFGALAAACELPALSLLALLGAWCAVQSTRWLLWAFVPATVLVAAAFFATNYLAHGTLQPPYMQRHVAGGWYDFEGSYWQGPQLRGVDAGEPSRVTYAFHSLLGHHGIFSLTPIWLISCYGSVKRLRRPQANGWLTLMTVVLTLVCLTFYIGMRPLEDRNYGGMTIGFRWTFWLIPLWTLMLLPACEGLSTQRVGRACCVLCLLVSVFSANYSPLNPWSHPWIYEYWKALGWL